MEARDAEVVVAGHICLDLIPTLREMPGGVAAALAPGKLVVVGPAVVSTGGAVSNTGQALHRLGFRTRLVGKVGDDLLGGLILDVLRRLSPALADDMVVAKGEASSYTVVINPPGVDRSFLHCPGANDTFTGHDVDDRRLTGARLFHFGYPPIMRRMYIDGGTECSRMFERVKARGLTTSLDVTLPDAKSESGLVDWRAFLERVLPYVDVFCPSVEEMRFMLRCDARRPTDATLLAEIARTLLDMGAAVVGLKLGDQGFYLRTSGDASRLEAIGPCRPRLVRSWVARELVAPCFRVEVAGTTGASDATIAGFLGGLLKGLSPERTVTAAVAVGAASVEEPDATSGIPHWSELERRIAAGWDRLPLSIPLPGWRRDETRSLWTA